MKAIEHLCLAKIAQLSDIELFHHEVMMTIEIGLLYLTASQLSCYQQQMKKQTKANRI